MAVNVRDTLTAYSTVEHKGIQYSTCRDYDYLSRYRGLRQVIHNYDDNDERFSALETPNPFESEVPVRYHKVSSNEVNRLDLIAEKYLGSASYAWVIAYFNKITDGFTVHSGQTIAIPKNISALLGSGELMGTVSALTLNLGSE